MDRFTIKLFLEDKASDCIDMTLPHWRNMRPGTRDWENALIGNVRMFEEHWPDKEHYWQGSPEKLRQFAHDSLEYSQICQNLSTQTSSIRNNLLNMSEKIQLFGSSVISVINSSSAGTDTGNLNQDQIDQFDSSLLSVEDIRCVQSFESYMEALKESITNSLVEVSSYQNKVSELKALVVNKIRPTVDGALAFSYPFITALINECRTGIDAAKKDGNTAAQTSLEENEHACLVARRASAYSSTEERHSSLCYDFLLTAFIELSDSISRVQPALSKFEMLWIDTVSFIQNAKTNADTIQTIKMLKVFKTRMQKIINDWNSVKALLGDQPVAIQ